MIGELTRLHQAALEERRRVGDRIEADDGRARDLGDAWLHMDREVDRAHAELLNAFYGLGAA